MHEHRNRGPTLILDAQMVVVYFFDRKTIHRLGKCFRSIAARVYMKPYIIYALGGRKPSLRTVTCAFAYRQATCARLHSSWFGRNFRES